MVFTRENSHRESNESQMQTSTPMIAPLSKEPLTWGVELEFVFAFHETQLDLNPFTDFSTVPAVTHPTVPNKKLAYRFRRYVLGFKNLIPWDRLPHRVYNSWGLHNNGKNPRLQPYNKEVHYVLERLLKEKCPSIDTRIEESEPINEKDNGMYEDNQWLLMRDYSVCGVGSKNIPAWLPRVAAAEAADWDSYGLELVSPIFNTGPNQGYNDIAQILEATKGKSSDLTGAFITNQCALHVHVGAPKDLRVLKELAVLIIVYESDISKLHPHCRRPEHPNARYAVESNRLRFLHQDKEDETRYTYGDLDVSNAALVRQPEDFLANIRAQIEACSTPQELALLMNWPAHGLGNELGNRARQVNFTAAARPPTAPYTVEFRQARGTLDASDVQKWVEFCTGLVRVARFYVDNPGRFPMKTFKGFRVVEDEEPVAERFYIMDLMNDMGMSEENKEYWRVRIAKFAARGGPLDRVDYEKEVGNGDDGEGIPGDGTDDDPGEGPCRVGSLGNSSGGQNGAGNSGRNSNPGKVSPGVNNGSGRGKSLPQSSPNGGRKSPKTGKKRSRDDDNEDDEEEAANSKKRKKTAGNKNADETTGGAPPGGESAGGENSGACNPDGNNPSSKALGKRKAQDDTDKDFEDDEEQQGHASKKQKKDGEEEGGQDGNNSNENMPQISQSTVAPIATTLANLFSYVAHFLQALPADSPPVIPPDIMRPVEGMVAPLGLMSPDDAMIYHDVKPFAWEVQGFHLRYWQADRTGYTIGQRRYVCSVLALLGSMRNQYPDSPYAAISAEELLALFDRVVGRRVCDDAEDNELADLMDAWTGNEFRVVIVSTAYGNRSAYRAGILEQQTQFGRNLYVHWTATGQSGISGGHWESMRRRPTPRPDPSGAAGPNSS